MGVRAVPTPRLHTPNHPNKNIRQHAQSFGTYIQICAHRKMNKKESNFLFKWGWPGRLVRKITFLATYPLWHPSRRRRTTPWQLTSTLSFSASPSSPAPDCAEAPGSSSAAPPAAPLGRSPPRGHSSKAWTSPPASPLRATSASRGTAGREGRCSSRGGWSAPGTRRGTRGGTPRLRPRACLLGREGALDESSTATAMTEAARTGRSGGHRRPRRCCCCCCRSLRPRDGRAS